MPRVHGCTRAVNVKYLFQALCPGHGPVALFGCFLFVFLSGATFGVFGRRHIYPVFAVGRERAMTKSSGMILDSFS